MYNISSAAVHRAMDKTAMPRIITTNYGVDVTGSTLGIVGLGGIGVKIAERARGFDMNILYHNRQQRYHADWIRLCVNHALPLWPLPEIKVLSPTKCSTFGAGRNMSKLTVKSLI